MPCALCNKWIEGEWLSWRKCSAVPTQGNRILVHTSTLPSRDVPCVLHLVLDTHVGHSWFFLCSSCCDHVQDLGGFPMMNDVALCRVRVSREVRSMHRRSPRWPVFVYDADDISETSWTDSLDSSLPDSWPSDLNPWIGRIEWVLIILPEWAWPWPFWMRHNMLFGHRPCYIS